MALFHNVYINDTRIDHPFILMIHKELRSEVHNGRLSLKYSPKMYIDDGAGTCIRNSDFIENAYATFGLSNDACWFVYDITAKNQDTLILKAVFVNENQSAVYNSADERKRKWLSLIPEEKKEKKISAPTSPAESRQQIFYGAPGTGKSFGVKTETEGWEAEGRVVRTTFHPDSDYSTFVGAYKPTTHEVCKYTNYGDKAVAIVDAEGNEIKDQVITYEFVAQAFLQAYVEAWRDRERPEFLVIEEINRGNCAQIFGDLFQLLDRNDEGMSEYAIRADKDLEKYLVKAFADADIEDEGIKAGRVLRLPSNLYIRATMNTSDQSLFPIDSAFKRRWDWQYVPISQGVEATTNKTLKWVVEAGAEHYDWWQFIERINDEIGAVTNSEDKKLGFFFCKAKGGVVSADVFVGKVVFYLWNDVFKDYGFDSEIFKNGEGRLTFADFYAQQNGKSVANADTIVKLFNNMGLQPIDQAEAAVAETE